MSSLDHDPVRRPSHYTQGQVECIEAIEAALGPQGFLAFLRGQVIKYNWRLGKKDHPVQDAEKAQWYGALLVKKLKEDSAEPHCRRGSDTKKAQAVPTTQGEALTEKKETSHDNSNSKRILSNPVKGCHYYSASCECPRCAPRTLQHRSQP